MFSFIRKKSLAKRTALTGAVLVLLAGLLFVSCADPVGGITDDAQQPSITTQPQDGIWDTSADVTFALTVTASVTDGGTLSYQWYSNSDNSNSDGTAIHEGTNATLTLQKENHTANGSYYFYVVVTNTNNKATTTKIATTTSNVATVTVSGGTTITTAEEPNITNQPQNVSWDINTADTKTLTVTASVTDGGTLHYQWYSNTSAATTGGTEVGTNSETLTLEKDNHIANGSYYYYVVVTNTNNNATTTKVVTKTSNVATVTVSGHTGIGVGIGDETVKLYWNTTLLEEGGSTTITTTEASTGKVSIPSGTYSSIIWYLNGGVAAQGITSVTLQNLSAGTYLITVETAAGGVTNTGSHSFNVQ